MGKNLIVVPRELCFEICIGSNKKPLAHVFIQLCTSSSYDSLGKFSKEARVAQSREIAHHLFQLLVEICRGRLHPMMHAKPWINGAIHSTKIFGNFGIKLKGSLRFNRKSFEKISPSSSVGPIRSKWTVPFDHSDPFSIPGPRCSVSSVYKMEENTHHCTFMDC